MPTRKKKSDDFCKGCDRDPSCVMLSVLHICLKLVFITKYAIKYPTHGCTNDDMRCTFSFMKLDYFSCYNDKGMI